MPDPFTHYVFAYLLGKRLGLQEVQMRVFLILTFVPDFDVIAIFFGLDFLRSFHGTVTHAILVSLLLGLATLIPLSKIFHARIRPMLPYFALPILLHLALDFFTAGMGRPYLWPLDAGGYSLPALFGQEFALPAYAALFALALGIAVLLALRKEYLWGPWKSYLRKR